MAEVTPSDAWRGAMRRRVVGILALFLAWTAAIETRLVYLQVYRHADLAARAERQQLRTVSASGKRGEIRDRRGHVLAYSEIVRTRADEDDFAIKRLDAPLLR